MYMTLESDYAVRIINCLAINDHRMDAQSIADFTSVTKRFSLKILRKLVASGLVKSYKGTHGGYDLAMAPSDITLRMILEAIDGEYHFSRCSSDEYDCMHMQKLCPYHDYFEDISKLVRQKLDDVTIEQLMTRKCNGCE